MQAKATEMQQHPAHHFTSIEQQKEAATLGMWMFLLTEIMFFGGLFTGYAVYRFRYPTAFMAASHELDVTLGAINTAVLIGSSLTVALAVWAGHHGKRKQICGWLVATIILGAAFLAIKAVEYHHKWEHHLMPGPGFMFEGPLKNQARIFFSFYFVMTGTHAVHMIVGLVLLAILAVRAWRGHFTSTYSTPVEMTGLYWHFVDLIWIYLFPLLYLLGLHHS